MLGVIGSSPAMGLVPLGKALTTIAPSFRDDVTLLVQYVYKFGCSYKIPQHSFVKSYQIAPARLWPGCSR